MSVDTWRPEVLRRALQAGATVINAADGMQTDEMWQVAAEFDVPIVVPFLSGPEPACDGDGATATRSRRSSSSSTPACATPTATACATAASSTRAPASPRELAVGGALPLPEAGVHQPRRAARVRAAAVHRAAVEGDRAARRAARDRGPQPARVRACALPRQGARASSVASPPTESGDQSDDERSAGVDLARRQRRLPAGRAPLGRDFAERCEHEAALGDAAGAARSASRSSMVTSS